jgi:hypothetical protein
MFNARAMTESQWLAGEEPGELTEAAIALGWMSDRKLRLWACACCRRIWHLLVDERSRRSVEVAELYADGEATEAERVAAHEAALSVPPFEATDEHPESAGWEEAASAASDAACDHLASDQHEFIHRTTSALSAVAAAKDGWFSTHFDTTREYRDRLEKFTEAVEAAEKQEQARLVREIVGNPFRQVKADPSWSAWNNGAARSLAQLIHDERAFDRLPILADALEDAGCDNADILDHLRGPGPHVRGCWVLDLLIDRK